MSDAPVTADDLPNPRKETNEFLAGFRDLVWETPFPIPRGIAFTLHAMARLSVAWGSAGKEQSTRRVVRATPSDIGRLARCSRTTAVRDIEWAVQNGFLKTLKASGRGTAARGVWLLEYPDFREVPEAVDTERRIRDRERLRTPAKVAKPSETAHATGAYTPIPTGVHAPSKERVRPLESAYTPLRKSVYAHPMSVSALSIARSLSTDSPEPPEIPAPPAVPPSGRPPVPGSSGPRPGLLVSEAELEFAEQPTADEGHQPQDAGAGALPTARTGGGYAESDEEFVSRILRTGRLNTPFEATRWQRLQGPTRGASDHVSVV